MFLATTVGVEGLVVAGLADLAGKIAYDIAGPVAKELGEMLKDELHPYRAARQAKLKSFVPHKKGPCRTKRRISAICLAQPFFIVGQNSGRSVP